MKTRRRLSILSLLMASVFLPILILSSCGIPTYFTPDKAFSIPSSSESDNTLEFSLNFYTDSTTGVSNLKDSAGLLLLYYCGDSGFSKTERNRIISNFSTTYVSPQNVVDPQSIDEPVITTRNSDQTYNTFAFTNAGECISAPNYNLGLDIESNYLANVTMSYEDGLVEFDDGTNILQMGFDSDFKPESNKYIYVFAAVSAQGQSFSNLYWTPLIYAGRIRINLETSE